MEIVISRFMEDLAWLSQEYLDDLSLKSDINTADINITIYNKGTTFIPNFQSKNITVIPLENVGRESHTFLYHIINKYNKLYNITIFLPGSCMDSTKQLKTKKVIDLACEKKSSIFYGQRFNDVYQALQNFMIQDVWRGTNDSNKVANPSIICQKASIRPFGRWYQHFFRDIKVQLVCWNAIFAVEKKDITQHSVEYYQNLIQCVSIHPNPEEGHFFERSWLAVFSPLSTCTMYPPNNEPTKEVIRQDLSTNKQSSFQQLINNMNTFPKGLKRKHDH